MPGRWRVDTPFGDDGFADVGSAEATAVAGGRVGKKRGESFVFVDDDDDSDADEGPGDGAEEWRYDSAREGLPAVQTSALISAFKPEYCNRNKADARMGNGAGEVYEENRTLPLRNSMPSSSGMPFTWDWSDNINEPASRRVDEGMNAKTKRRKTSDTNTLQSKQQSQTSAREFEYINFDGEGVDDDVSQPRLHDYFPAVRAASSVPPQIWKSPKGLNHQSGGSSCNDLGYNYVSLSEALLKSPRNPTSGNSLLSTSSHPQTNANNDNEPITSFLSPDQTDSIDLDLPQESPPPWPISSPFPTLTGTTITTKHNSHLQHRPRHRKRKPSFALSSVPSPSQSSSRFSTTTTTSTPYPFSLSLSSQNSPFTHPLTGLSLVMGYNTSLPKSRLDMYITAMRQLALAAKVAGVRPLRHETQRAITAEGVLWAVREAWPAAEGYWNLTATFHGFLAAEHYRNFPTPRTYASLPPAYRPTRLQLAVPHSPMIDWLPWPDVRDLAIRYQDEIDLDALFRVAIHNVVAGRRKGGRRMRRGWEGGGAAAAAGEVVDVTASEQGQTKKAQGHAQGQVRVQDGDGNREGDRDDTSFRVWDLVCLEKANGTDPLAEPGLDKKPVPRSPGVKAVLRAYDLEYDDFDTQKLDDGFWEAFPALYCETAASGWRVQSLEGMGMGTVDVGRPVGLRGEMVWRLKGRIERVVGGEILV